MIDNFADNRGTVTQAGNLMRLQNGLVEEVSPAGQGTAYVLVSYTASRPNGTTAIERLRLNTGRNTIITNRAGVPVEVQDIQEGSHIDAVFSPAMTRSMPPQSAAFLIVVRQQAQPPASTATGRVASVDVRNNTLTTGNPRDMNSQTVFIITDDTEIIDRNGRPINLRSLRRGDRVRITHSNAQTASIPPQTTAFRIERQ